MINKINKIIFKYLDSQNFVVIESTKKIYFVNSESDEYSTISYNKNNGWCIIYHELIKEISAFFSIKESDSEKVVSMWVENTLQMRVTDTGGVYNVYDKLVENTLQMRVTDTLYNGTRHHRQLRIPVQMRVTNTNLVNS
jgi:hypothetical protein